MRLGRDIPSLWQVSLGDDTYDLGYSDCLIGGQNRQKFKAREGDRRETSKRPVFQTRIITGHGRSFHSAGRRSGHPNTRLGDDEDEMPVTRRRDTLRPRK